MSDLTLPDFEFPDDGDLHLPIEDIAEGGGSHQKQMVADLVDVAAIPSSSQGRKELASRTVADVLSLVPGVDAWLTHGGWSEETLRDKVRVGLDAIKDSEGNISLSELVDVVPNLGGRDVPLRVLMIATSFASREEGDKVTGRGLLRVAYYLGAAVGIFGLRVFSLLGWAMRAPMVAGSFVAGAVEGDTLKAVRKALGKLAFIGGGPPVWALAWVFRLINAVARVVVRVILVLSVLTGVLIIWRVVAVRQKRSS
jgi:hypothetical protein